VPYLSASAVVIHYEEALYQVYAPLPLPYLYLYQWRRERGRGRVAASSDRTLQEAVCGFLLLIAFRSISD